MIVRRFVVVTFGARHLSDDIADGTALIVARDTRGGRLRALERDDGSDVARVERGDVQVKKLRPFCLSLARMEYVSCRGKV